MRQPHQYRDLEPEVLEDVLSNFLVEKWRFSMVSTFARNEAAFEMQYIYGCDYRSSSSTVAGSAFHAAAQKYFTVKKETGEIMDMVGLEAVAFAYIDDVPANKWKLQKTTPTVINCIEKASKLTRSYIENFLSEIYKYEDDVAAILEVEFNCYEYLTINGVDIPLPCSGTMDLVLMLTNGRRVIVDHKTKAAFTSDEEMAMAMGKQAITYVKLYEAKRGEQIDEIWFIENKGSKNKEGGDQLNKFVVELDKDTRSLYESFLYDPLKRLIEAVNNPDYTYVINDADNFVDRAEIYNFWCRTMISEVEDFNVPEAKREIIAKRLRKIRNADTASISPSVIKAFKEKASSFIQYDLSNKDMTQDQKIEHVLRSFGTTVKVAHTFDGYSSNTYLLDIAAGVKINSIYGKRLDIANALDVANVRISSELKVHEGRSYLSIDVSKKREKDLIFDPEELDGMKIPLGKDNFGNTIVWDLLNHSTPHALICGATGSGKSVCVRSIIEYAKLAGIKDIIIFDPKFEFVGYANDSKIIVLNEIWDIVEYMQKMVEYMNKLVREGRKSTTLIIFDEFADAVAQDKSKTIEESLRILLQKGRSSGFRIAAATQRASVKVITGDAKVNFPVQICFRVPKEIDSKVVIDEAGAESLAGMGDGLIRSPQYPDIVRFQAYFKPEPVEA